MNLAAIVAAKAALIGRSFTTKRRKAEFVVIGISDCGIKIGVGSSNNERRISPTEVDLMGACWKEFKAGIITRSELANGDPKIFNTSYLEVIFTEIETHH